MSQLSVTSQQKAGTVIAQDPQAGTKAKKGSNVALTVSTGPGNATVPSVVGETLKQAKSSIEIANLKVGKVVKQSSTTVANGQVIGTSPQAGSNPAVNTPVTIFVSTGPPPVNVPDVTSESVAQAKATLEAPPRDFGVTTTYEVSTTSAPGTVISQSPAGGESVKPGYDDQPRGGEGAADRGRTECRPGRSAERPRRRSGRRASRRPCSSRT